MPKMVASLLLALANPSLAGTIDSRADYTIYHAPQENGFVAQRQIESVINHP